MAPTMFHEHVAEISEKHVANLTCAPAGIVNIKTTGICFLSPVMIVESRLGMGLLVTGAFVTGASISGLYILLRAMNKKFAEQRFAVFEQQIPDQLFFDLPVVSSAAAGKALTAGSNEKAAGSAGSGTPNSSRSDVSAPGTTPRRAFHYEHPNPLASNPVTINPNSEFNPSAGPSLSEPDLGPSILLHYDRVSSVAAISGGQSSLSFREQIKRMAILMFLLIAILVGFFMVQTGNVYLMAGLVAGACLMSVFDTKPHRIGNFDASIKRIVLNGIY